MVLDVTEGYIGHIENPKRPEMNMHVQINAIALDLGISPVNFIQTLQLTSPTQENLQSVFNNDLQLDYSKYYYPVLTIWYIN